MKTNFFPNALRDHFSHSNTFRLTAVLVFTVHVSIEAAEKIVWIGQQPPFSPWSNYDSTSSSSEPFDGRDPDRFNEIMTVYCSSASPEGIQIHLMEGTYTTDGNAIIVTEAASAPGFKLMGAGKTKTT